MNYPFPRRYDAQTTREIYRCEITDCISEVTWYVYWIEAKSSRDDSELIPEANLSGDASSTKSVKPIATNLSYENSKAINHDTNEIW